VVSLPPLLVRFALNAPSLFYASLTTPQSRRKTQAAPTRLLGQNASLFGGFFTKTPLTTAQLLLSDAAGNILTL
jgi:hypothetical protein